MARTLLGMACALCIASVPAPAIAQEEGWSAAPWREDLAAGPPLPDAG
ncbi:hypothetical protein [Sphingobium sp. SYK-6]|nr:hypothetical protein [Sphingobium sp. SYK-6]